MPNEHVFEINWAKSNTLTPQTLQMTERQHILSPKQTTSRNVSYFHANGSLWAVSKYNPF